MIAAPAKRFRLSIAGLMTIVAMVAIGLVALRAETGLWASLIFTFAIIMLSLGSVAAISAHRQARSTWAGMAIFGWSYLIIAFGPWPNNTCRPPRMLPTYLLTYFQSYILSGGEPYRFSQTMPTPSGRVNGMFQSARPASGANIKTYDLDIYDQTGNSLGVLLFGLIGAFMGHFVADRVARRESPGSECHP